MTTHAEARALATAAFQAVIGRGPSVPELRLLLAKGKKESGYGDGWKPPGTGSNNIGAVQWTSDWTGATFSYTDTHADGTRYTWKFRAYPTPAAGWEDFTRELFVNPQKGRSAVLAAASADDPWAFSYQVVATRYSESSGPTLLARCQTHYRWLKPAVDEITKAFGWPAPLHDSSGGGSAWPFPPALPVPPAPPPPPDPPLAEALATVVKAMGDLTIALGTLHADIGALRTDLAQIRADLLARFPRAAE